MEFTYTLIGRWNNTIIPFSGRQSGRMLVQSRKGYAGGMVPVKKSGECKMCMNAIYLNPTIISRAEYGIEYGPSLEYLKDMGTWIYERIEEYTNNGIPTGEIRIYNQAQLYKPTDIRFLSKGISWTGALPCTPKYTGWEKDGNYLYHAGCVWINSSKDNPGDPYSFVIADGKELRIVDEVTKSTYPVICAPAAFTKTKKITYLKAIVQTMIDDPDNIRPYVPLSDIGHNQVTITQESVTA